ncbi:DNA polymerase Y family protein [Bdellovibrio sp. HCB337]|uniref:DNA polymerase Y family protein n=1 Tax=Bdellovibrio sp. HCB337 TaxID=3394358 RepID=UPI0039A50616
MVRWLYLDLNSFFASCEQQESPELRGKPVAVVPMMANTTAVLAASYEAKALGIKTGTLVGDAKRMCPGLQLVKSRHKTYIQYHQKIKEVLESCIPIHSVCSVDEFACELTGSQQNLEVATALAMKIKNEVRERVGECMTSSIGLAPNMLLAKMATDMQKPNGFITIEPEELPKRLFPLKLRDIPGIGPKMEQRLNQKGVTTMEQLLGMNEKQMYGLWGSLVGSRYYYLLKGENLLVPRQKSQSISHQHVLPPDQRSWEGALGVAQKLLSKTAIRMRKENFLTRRLSLSVKFMNHYEKFEKSLKVQETQDTALLLSHLNRFFTEMPRKYKPLMVSVVLSDFQKSENHQFSFFENTKKEQLFGVVDKLNEKFGKDTVYLACFQDKKDVAPTAIAFSRIPELEE